MMPKKSFWGGAVAPSTARLQPVIIGGRPVYLTDEGSGPAVIFLHGLPGAHSDFRYLTRACADLGLRAIAIDMPGFGETPWESFPAKTSMNRAVLPVKIADALDIHRFVIVGHSFGGVVAFHTAAQFRERVSGLGLVNSVGVTRHRAKRMAPTILMRTISAALTANVGTAKLEELGARMYRQIGLDSVPTAKELLHVTQIGATADFKAHRQAVRAVRCPVLVAAAQNDKIVEPAVTTTLVEAFSPAIKLRQLRFRRGGHALMKFGAEPIAHAIAALLHDPDS